MKQPPVLENLVRVWGGLELGERDHAELALEAPWVQTVDRFPRFVLNRVELGPLEEDGLKPVEAIEGLWNGLAVDVATRAD